MLTRSLLAAVAGVALALTFPPTHAFWLLPVCVAAYFVLTARLPARRAWVPGLAFGVGFQYTLLWWMHVVGTVPWLALSGIQALWYAVLAVAATRLRRLPAAPLWLAAAWVAMENIRTDWPAGGMPWGRLAYAVVDTPLAPTLPYAGATGVSLVLALLGTLLAGVLQSRGRARFVPVALLVGVAAVALLPRVAPYRVTPVSSVEVAAIQGNVPGNGTDVLAHYRQVTSNHVDETIKLETDVVEGRTPRPDFVVWPENSTAIDPFEDPQMRADITGALSAIKVPILVGAVVDGGPRHVLNQGIVFDPVTGAGDRYTKWHPVPFGEYVPWRWLFGSHFTQLSQIPRDMVRGTRTEPLRIDGARVADAICFDVAYDDGLYAQISHGGQLVVVQTSNALFIHTSQIEQQFAMSRLRAMETGRYVVVAAINGLTGVIAPDGHVVTQVPRQTESYAEARVGLVDTLTPAVRIGPWLGRGCVLVTALGLLLGLAKYRRRTDAANPPSRPPADLPAAIPDRTPA
jgi:apolipoprotein N-acyltransferase